MLSTELLLPGTLKGTRRVGSEAVRAGLFSPCRCTVKWFWSVGEADVRNNQSPLLELSRLWLRQMPATFDKECKGGQAQEG